MLKRFFVALGLLALLGTAAVAGQINTFTGPQDPSQLNNSLNTVIISGNANWSAQGRGFIASTNVSPNASTTVSLGPTSGATGISPATQAGWLKFRGFTSSSSVTPTFFIIPYWGCPGC